MRYITKGVGALVHVRYVIEVSNGYCIQPRLVHADLECSVFLVASAIDVAHFVSAGLRTSVTTILLIWCFSNSLRVDGSGIMQLGLGVPLLKISRFFV